MIAEDFGPVVHNGHVRVLATESIAGLRLREHVRAPGQKTREGTASAVRNRHVSVRFSRDLLVRTLLRFISAGPMAKGW